MNAGEQGEGSLKSFYGYKETFGRNATWVDIPRELTFVNTTNPYEDGEDGPGGSGGYAEGETSFLSDAGAQFDRRGDSGVYELAQAAYPVYATHGLEALSAVASQDQYNYAPPPAPMTQQEQSSPQQATMHAQHSQGASSQNIEYILNPASVTTTSPAVSNLDPQLHSPTSLTHPTISSPETHHQNFEHVRTDSYGSSQGRPSLRLKGSNRGLRSPSRY